MQWLTVLFALSLVVGLRRRAGPAANAILVLGVVVIVGFWYAQLVQSQ